MTRLSGTLGSSSAPVEDSTTFSSISIGLPDASRSGATAEPVAMTTLLRQENLLASIRRGDFHLMRTGARRQQPAGADESVDLVLLEQEGDAVHIGGDGVVLMLHHRGKIEARRVDDDPERRETMRRLAKHMRSVQQRLGRDAADIEACSAEGRPFFNDRGL